MAELPGDEHVRCDQCNETMSVPSFVIENLVLEKPWRVVHVNGWAGSFHCCSFDCEIGLRKRMRNSIPPGKP